MAQLADYLDWASRQRFEWGKHDCCQFVRGWVRLRTGRDPASGWTYHSEMGAALLAHRNGGLISLVGKLAAGAGMAPTDTPETGDIGVVSVLTENGVMPVAAIFTGRAWALLTTGGLTSARVPALAAWRLNG